jgi:hypothetical protein
MSRFESNRRDPRDLNGHISIQKLDHLLIDNLAFSRDFAKSKSQVYVLSGGFPRSGSGKC